MFVSNLLLELDRTISLIIIFMYIYNMVKEAVITTNTVKGIIETTPLIITSSFRKNIGLGGIPANPIIDKTDANFVKVKELWLVLFWVINKLKIRVNFINL